MNNKKISKQLAMSVSSILKTTLHIGANTASCGLIYQPKEPKDLARFKKIK